MASYSKPGQQWTFYEINPDVIKLAAKSRYFTYLQQCASGLLNVVEGDARLKLQDAPTGSYGLIVLDAFSSDAIPVHLVTKQTLDLYLSKLAAGGILLTVFETSIAKMRVFRVPQFLGAALMLGLLATLLRFVSGSM